MCSCGLVSFITAEPTSIHISKKSSRDLKLQDFIWEESWKSHLYSGASFNVGAAFPKFLQSIPVNLRVMFTVF